MSHSFIFCLSSVPCSCLACLSRCTAFYQTFWSSGCVQGVPCPRLRTSDGVGETDECSLPCSPVPPLPLPPSARHPIHFTCCRYMCMHVRGSKGQKVKARGKGERKGDAACGGRTGLRCLCSASSFAAADLTDADTHYDHTWVFFRPLLPPFCCSSRSSSSNLSSHTQRCPRRQGRLAQERGRPKSYLSIERRQKERRGSMAAS